MRRPTDDELKKLTFLQKVTLLPENLPGFVTSFPYLQEGIITKKSLNQPIDLSSEFDGMTPLFNLMGCEIGQAFLLDNWEAISLHLTKEGLHDQVTGNGANFGRSAFSCLPGTHLGRLILLHYWEDIDALTDLNDWRAIPDLFIWLSATRAGRVLLADHADVFAQLITRQDLQHPIVFEDDESNQTVEACLISDENGQRFLAAYEKVKQERMALPQFFMPVKEAWREDDFLARSPDSPCSF